MTTEQQRYITARYKNLVHDPSVKGLRAFVALLQEFCFRDSFIRDMEFKLQKELLQP